MAGTSPAMTGWLLPNLAFPSLGRPGYVRHKTSEIEHQPRRLRSRNADLHQFIRGALCFRQDIVAMIGDALENVDAARRAGLTALHYIDTPTLVGDLRRLGVEVPPGEG